MSFGFDIALISSAFLMGLLGSTHCVGMCGGISAALTFALPADKRQGKSAALFQLTYNLGRLFTYTALGVVAGLLGAGILSFLQGNMWPRVLAGIFMIIMGLYLGGWWLGLQKLEKAGAKIWQLLDPLRKRFLPVNTLPKAFIAGGIWGFLPCGLVYSALALSLTRADAQASGLTMLAFGLGTLPALLITGALAGKTRQFLQQTKVRQLAGLLVIGFGIWTMLPPLMHAKHMHHGASPHSANTHAEHASSAHAEMHAEHAHQTETATATSPDDSPPASAEHPHHHHAH